MTRAQLLRSMTVRGAIAVAAAVVVEVAVNALRRWGGDLLSADTAAAIRYAATGAQALGIAAIAYGARRALGLPEAPKTDKEKESP